MIGHTVEVADSGRAGIEKAGAFQPDVIFCDIGLPGMDGYEVARAFARIQLDKTPSSSLSPVTPGRATSPRRKRPALVTTSPSRPVSRLWRGSFRNRNRIRGEAFSRCEELRSGRAARRATLGRSRRKRPPRPRTRPPGPPPAEASRATSRASVRSRTNRRR